MTVAKWVIGLAMLAFLAGPGLGWADETAEAGRKIMKAGRDAVVKVEVVIQSKWVMNGVEMENQEFKSEVTGTVLDPSGLVLVSLTAIDPSKFMENLMPDGGRDMKMEMKLDLKGVKLILPDETELDAKVVLRDRDLDMVFLLPKQKPPKAMAFVDMNRQSRPAIMDEIVILGRLSKVANHAPSILASRISALVSKPRPFYIPQAAGDGMENNGTPVFTLDGQVAGVILMRISKTEGAGGFGAMMGGAGAMGITTVIMPAAEILEAAKQALALQSKE
ncbi:MAG: hypothetical protein JXB25_08635 [Deltaproteobacteria bacterium]|nr:hypothetical protein [Deltaproteobacteria bacterium]